MRMRFFLLYSLSFILQGCVGQINNNTDSSPLVFETSKTRRTTRRLKSNKSKSKKEVLKAKLKDKEGYLVGTSKIEFDGDDMEIDCDFSDLPSACDNGDCFVSINRGTSCSEKKGLYYDDWANPWSPYDSDFESDHGDAHFSFDTSNGYDFDDNEGRVMLIYSKKPPKSSKKSKSRKLAVKPEGETNQRELQFFDGRFERRSRRQSNRQSRRSEGVSRRQSRRSHYQSHHCHGKSCHSHYHSHHSHDHHSHHSHDYDDDDWYHYSYDHSHSHDDDWDIDDYKVFACGKLKE